MRAKGAIFLGLFTLSLRAADAPATSDDAISDAKKDLATIKAPTNAQDPSASLPSIQMKDLGPVPAASTPRMPVLTDQEKEEALDPTKKKHGTGNWLVDAMDRNADPQKNAKGKDRDELLRGEAELLRGEEKDGQSAEGPRKRRTPGKPLPRSTTRWIRSWEAGSSQGPRSAAAGGQG